MRQIKGSLRKRVLALGLAIIGSSATILLTSLPSAAAELQPVSIALSTGTSNGGLAGVTAANDGKLLNLYTNRQGRLRVDFQFSGAAGAAKVNMLFRQQTASNTFIFKALNANGSYTDLGTVSGATSFRTLSFALPSNTVLSGAVTLRVVSSSGSDNCDLDYLAIQDESVSAPSPTPTPTPVATPTPSPTPTPTPAPASLATFTPGTTWYWQLQGTINTSRAAKAYGIDLEDSSAALIASLKSSGHTVICYFSAGTYENWRSDAYKFPSSVIGNTVSGWAGENWLDIRSDSVKQIMAARLDLAKAKGCQGVDPDNVDGYANKSGFPFTMQDQLNFNSYLAAEAHARGLIIGLKNANDLVQSLVSKFDFAVVEECFLYNECSAYSPFISQNKAVFNAEYSNTSSSICSQAAALKFSTVFYNLDLDGSVYNPCP